MAGDASELAPEGAVSQPTVGGMGISSTLVRPYVGPSRVLSRSWVDRRTADELGAAGVRPVDGHVVVVADVAVGSEASEIGRVVTRRCRLHRGRAPRSNERADA